MFQDIHFNQQHAFNYAPLLDDCDQMIDNFLNSNVERQIERKNSIENLINGFQNDSNYHSFDNCFQPQSQTRTLQGQEIPPWSEGFTVSNSIINFDEQNGSDNQMFSNGNFKSNNKSESSLIDFEHSSQSIPSANFDTQQTPKQSPSNNTGSKKKQTKRKGQCSGEKENEKSRNRSNQPLIQKAYFFVTNSHIDKNCPSQFQRTLVRQLERNGKHKLIKKLNDDKITIKKRNGKKNLKKHKKKNLSKHINRSKQNVEENSQSNVEENSQSNVEEKNAPNFTHQLFNEFFQQSSSSLAQIVDILDQKIIDKHIDTNKKIASSKQIKKLGETQQKVMDKCIRQVHKEFHKCMKRKIIRKCKDRTYKCESFMDDEFRAKLDEISQTHKKVLEDIIVFYPAIKVVEQKQ